ncbi:ead/Ea22-like family protein [Serratia marcescens]|uniref:ead/Ea22-like family protein n=1 Tax=Serratia marcescens TaxID=615 RepID=UPI0013DA718A|nr:ead/Ea22-like family protein [Serratia marcescens]
MDKFSELKAAAMAATPGPWILDDDSWSEGDNANVSTEERYDGRIVSIAQIEGGGSESGFDEPFSTEQQANARYITAANPAVILALLAELEFEKQNNAGVAGMVEDYETKLEAKDKRIAELERTNQSQDDHINQQQDRIDSLEKKNGDLGRSLGAAEKRLATPVRLPGSFYPDGDIDCPLVVELYGAIEAIRAAGFTVEGDE